MPPGYVTTDQIDFNDFWYGGPSGPGALQALDMYRAVNEPQLMQLVLPWPETMFRYGIGARNGYQLLGDDQIPDAKRVDWATLVPDVRRYGYKAGTSLNTLRRSTGWQIRLAMERPLLEDPENFFTRLLETLIRAPLTNNANYGWYSGQFSSEEKITAPVPYRQNVFAAGHTHYLTTAGTLALSHFVAMKETIRHHGNKGELAAFINSAQVTVLENAAAWTNSGIIRSPVSDAVAIAGFEEQFRLNGILFFVTDMVPAGWVLMIQISDVGQDRPVVMFEPANIRGLQLVPGSQYEVPIIESWWERWFGFKVYNRGAGAVLKITGSGDTTYTAPNFDAPSTIS